MPAVIERAVRKQNVHFLHNRIQYSVEFFQFMRKLATANAGLENSVREDFCCFSYCFLDGQANSWVVEQPNLCFLHWLSPSTCTRRVRILFSPCFPANPGMCHHLTYRV